MITFITEKFVTEDKAYRQGFCLSDDEKPVDDSTMANGSKLIEMDTGSTYYYDEANSSWVLWESGSVPEDDEQNNEQTV